MPVGGGGAVDVVPGTVVMPVESATTVDFAGAGTDASIDTVECGEGTLAAESVPPRLHAAKASDAASTPAPVATPPDMTVDQTSAATRKPRLPLLESGVLLLRASTR